VHGIALRGGDKQIKIAAYVRPVIKGLDRQRSVSGQFESAHNFIQRGKRVFDLPLFGLRQIPRIVNWRHECASRPFLQKLQGAKVYALQFRKLEKFRPLLLGHTLQHRKHFCISAD
jgi:hypothetical protein